MLHRPTLRSLLPAWSGLRSPLPWAVVVISMACALVAWSMLRAEARDRGIRAFDLRAQHLVDALQGKLKDIELDLRGNAALLAVNGPSAPRAWRESAGAMNLAEAYPGLEVIGYAALSNGKAVTTLLQPAGGLHGTAAGFDLYSDVRLRAALAALSQGEARSTFIHIAPWIRSGSTTRYFWMAVPVKGATAGTDINGIEWALVRLDHLLASLMDHSYAHMDIELLAPAGGDSSVLLVDSNGRLRAHESEASQVFRRSTQIGTSDGALTLHFGVDADFLDEFNSAKANLALAGGLTISALLFLIAWYSATLAQKATEMARQMTSAHGRVEARLQGIIGTAMDAIITVDDSQHITMFNRAAEAIFGYRADEIIGQPLDRLIPQAHRAGHREHVRRFGDTGSTARAMGAEISVTGLRANGEEFPIDASISRLKEGEHLLYTVILRDITRRRQSEEALTRTQHNLEHSNERLRQLSLHVETTRETERIRIAREIHDDLAATLTGIKMDLSAARDSLRDDPERADLRLRASLGLMDAAVVTTRRIINDLRPSILDNLGVWAAIEWQVAETARRASIRCETSVDPALEAVQVPPEVSTALFRIVQEALNNIWRHAEAHNANVRCALAEGHLEVTISDDGRGMDAAAMHKSGHWGLLGMEERVRAHGGSIAIDSALGRGTSILVRIPLAP